MINISTLNVTQQRALNLLGSGHLPEKVALACGVTPGYISQLLSEEVFAEEVAKLRYENLQKHNEHDGNLDRIEAQLLQQLESFLPMLTDPMKIAAVFYRVNQAKRRGSSTAEVVTNQQTIINLNMPQVVVNKFTTNINNQVVNAGGQELLTIQSNQLLNKVKPPQNDQRQLKEITGVANEA